MGFGASCCSVEMAIGLINPSPPRCAGSASTCSSRTRSPGGACPDSAGIGLLSRVAAGYQRLAQSVTRRS